MSPTKKFLLLIAGGSLVVNILINVLLGPPGLTQTYQDQYKHEHEHYVEITKSDEYKRYMQRPELHAPETGSHLAEALAFVDEYESREAFQEEQSRMHVYELFFEFFNAGILILIAFYFGRRPLLNFLDEGIHDLHDRLDRARRMREDTADRLGKARANVEALPRDETRIDADTRERIEREMAEMEAANRTTITAMEQVLVDRKNREFQLGALRVKQELVNEAMDRIAGAYESDFKGEMNPKAVRHHEDLIDAFATRLEQRS